VNRGRIFLLVLLFVVVVGGALLVIGLVQGDDTDSVDPNGVNGGTDSAPSLTQPLTLPR
jgi:hypothetical protein